MSPVALALSPHLDDAVFSCGGTLAQLAAAGWRVVVATAFTRSVPDPRGFALACQLDKGLGPAVDYMALRRTEDERACAALGAAAPVWLDLPEAPHRGYGSAPALFAKPLPVDDGIVPLLATALARCLEEVKPDLVLAPQAIGGHVDHVQLVRAMDGLTRPRPVLWWRDFPYVDRAADPPRPFAARFDTSSECELALDEAAIAAKRRACLAYGSQIGFQFGGAAGLDEKLARTGGRELFRVAGPVPAALGALPVTSIS